MLVGVFDGFLIHGVYSVPNRRVLCCIGVQRFYGKRPHLLLWAGARRRKWESNNEWLRNGGKLL